MTAALVVVVALVLGGFAVLLHCLLSANDTAEERSRSYHDEAEALRQVKARAEKRRAEREACAVMHDGGNHAA